MTHWKTVWEPAAVDALAGALADDPQGVRDVLAAVDAQSATATLTGTPWGPHHLRMRVGRWRLLYRTTGDTIHIEHTGRVG